MSILTLPQARIPIGWTVVDNVTYPVVIDIEWMRYLAVLDERAGGVTGSSTTELSESAFEDSGIEETKAQIYRLYNDIGVLPKYEPIPQEQFLETKINELTAQVHKLQTMINDLQQGYQI